MRRREWAGLAFVLAELAAAAGCGVDSYLTCGAPCEDASADATVPDSGVGTDASDASSAKDVSVKDADAEAGCLGSFCQGSSGCCSSAPICNAGHRCATSCGALDASCTQQGGDTCCQPYFCNQGHCSACFEAGVQCSEDWQCCSNACVGSSCQ
jgi:hypothetical protein